ncbi:MAG: DUF2335 domain-containing protein [Magnetococcus sp. WYHC-3]
MVQQRIFSGPLPPPAILKQYDELFPGAADQIFQMALDDAEHVHKMEEIQVNSIVHGHKAGQGIAFILSVMALGVVAYLGYLGLESAAATVGGATLVGLAGVFVLGRKKE